MLKSFPVKSLREYFDLTGLRQDDLIDNIIRSQSPEDIMIFAFEQFGYLHQHVYIYDINTNISDVFNLAGGAVISDIVVGNKRSLDLIFTTQFSFFNTATFNQEQLTFKCPVRLEVTGRMVVIKINILERNINNYFEHKVFSIGRSVEDDNIIGRIRAALGDTIILTPKNLTKGVKDLWNNNIIDAAYVKFKKSKSTTTESMDEEHTLKDSLPDVYAEITGAPLEKNVFRVKVDVEELITIFAIEPQIGKMMVSRFPNQIDGVDKLLNMIIEKN